MIATKTLLLLACLVVGCHANLNTKIVIANKTPVPLIAVGEGETRYMYPGQEATFGGGGESARMYLFRWCPGAGDTGGPNSQVCICGAANFCTPRHRSSRCTQATPGLVPRACRCGAEAQALASVSTRNAKAMIAVLAATASATRHNACGTTTRGTK